jgi:hypothetical protein
MTAQITDLDEVVKQYINWLQSMIDDKDIQPVQNYTYLQCWNKLIDLIGEDMMLKRSLCPDKQL